MRARGGPAAWPRGVLAAVPTPFDAEGRVALASVAPLLDDVAARGGHGVLLAGSTGEGSSLALDERLALVRAAAAWRASRPPGAAPFALLCGSGHPAWPEAARATADVVAAGADAAVVLPPYYFQGVTDGGLEGWFRRVIDDAAARLAGGGFEVRDGAVAADRADGRPALRCLLYDIPRLTGVPVPTAVLRRLADHFGPAGPLVGLKDSGGDAAETRRRVADLPDLAVLTGTDGHLADHLAGGGAGAITALAALRIDLLRRVWDRSAAVGVEEGTAGRRAAYARAAAVAAAPTADSAWTALAAAQADLDRARAVLDRWPTAAAVKAALAARLGGDGWHVRPPLTALTPGDAAAFVQAMAAIDPPARSDG